MKPNCQKEHEHNREQFLARAKELFKIEDTTGIELFGTLHRTAHISQMFDMQLSEEMELSGPRWRLMMRLMIEAHMGNNEGLTPTDLSKSQRVSKNTISSLLRGLEEQGLIQRNLDPADLRVFRIQLTEAGRALVMNTAPRRMEGLNKMLVGFTPDEIRQFISLLEKLQNFMLAEIADAAILDEKLP